MATYVLDETSGQLTTGNTVGDSKWVDIQGGQFFGGSATYPPFAAGPNDASDSGNYGTLKVTFQGTSIAFIGNTPPPTLSQNIFVSIDGGPSYQTWYNDPAPPCALQWYQSPKLSDGSHTISITHIAGTSVDVMLVTAGQNTPLSGKRLIVDDGDSAITYSGNWERKTGLLKSKDTPHTGQPYGNATHQSSSVGSSATFRFTGTSVSVYSVFDYSHLGSVGVTYTLDSSASGRTYVVSSDTPQYQSGYLQIQNTLLWASDTISAGDHTLKIEITSSTNGAALVLDYLTYIPSFNTLAAHGGVAQPARPDTTAVTSPTNAAGASTPATSGSTASNSGNGSAVGSGGSSTVLSAGDGESTSTSVAGNTVFGTVTVSGPGFTPPASALSEPGTSTQGRGPPIGAIVGGVVGGLALLVIVFLLVLCRKRMSRRKDSDLAPKEILPADSPIEPTSTIEPFPTIEPFRLDSPSNSSLHTTEKGRRMRGYGAGSLIVPPASSTTRTMSEKSHLSSTGNSNYISSTASVMQSPSISSFPLDSHEGNMSVQDLQTLIHEFNRATLVHGEANMRVVELQTRISELTRQASSSAGGSASLTTSSRRDTLSTAVPPPYES